MLATSPITGINKRFGCAVTKKMANNIIAAIPKIKICPIKSKNRLVLMREFIFVFMFTNIIIAQLKNFVHPAPISKFIYPLQTKYRRSRLTALYVGYRIVCVKIGAGLKQRLYLIYQRRNKWRQYLSDTY